MENTFYASVQLKVLKTFLQGVASCYGKYFKKKTVLIAEA